LFFIFIFAHASSRTYLENAITHPQTLCVKEHVGDVAHVPHFCEFFQLRLSRTGKLADNQKDLVLLNGFFRNERMRLAFIIVCLTTIGIGLVHIRRQEVALRHEVQSKQLRHVALRREIWDRQVRLGHMTTPRNIRHRAEILGLDINNTASGYSVAMRD
jgi:hypothetical protein